MKLDRQYIQYRFDYSTPACLCPAYEQTCEYQRILSNGVSFTREFRVYAFSRKEKKKEIKRKEEKEKDKKKEK